MNKIVEAINYSSDSYWGDILKDLNLMQELILLVIVELSQGNNRVVKTDFGLKLQGYIIPEAMNAFINKHPTKQFSKSILTNITEVIAEDLIEHDRARQPINKVGDSGSGIGYDKIGHQQIG